jgi:hypothetical protein
MNWQRDATDILEQVLAADLNGGKVIVTTPAEIGLADPPTIGGWFSGAVYDIVGADDRDCVLVVAESHWHSWLDRVGVALHEASHWLDVGRQPIIRSQQIRQLVPQDPASQAQIDVLFRVIAAVQLEQAEPIAVPRWYGHGADFVRCAAMVAHRAGQIAEAIRPRHLRFGEQYFPAPYRENEWMALLADEIRLPGPIRQIIAQRPAERFTEHFGYATQTPKRESEQ